MSNTILNQKCQHHNLLIGAARLETQVMKNRVLDTTMKLVEELLKTRHESNSVYKFAIYIRLFSFVYGIVLLYFLQITRVSLLYLILLLF